MPLRKRRLAVLDASVYIENLRSRRFERQLIESALVPRCSSVVLHELLRGARTPVEIDFVSNLRRQSVVITPTEQHWFDAAKLLRKIRTRDLALDVLIALSARSIGATLITCNERDFRAIGRHLVFDAAYWR